MSWLTRSSTRPLHAVTSTSKLLENGVHFGHQTRRWNPKVKRFILTERNGIHIIDLQQSLAYIDRAFEFVRATVAHGGTVLFVGTKKQARGAIEEHATRVGQPFVSHRWLGGMLTNFQTVSKRIQRMIELEEIDFEDVAGSIYTKKELLLLRRELIKLQFNLGGIRNLTTLPALLWIVDTQKERLAIAEAKKLGIPVVAILDTNCDPDEIDFPIPGNDDALRSVYLLTKIVAEAVSEGLAVRDGLGVTELPDEPLAEWERELLEGSRAERETEERGPSQPEDWNVALSHERLRSGKTTDKGRPIGPDPHHLVLGSVNRALEPHEIEQLSDQLGLKFRKMWDQRQWVVGSVILQKSYDDPLVLRAVRHWDGSPGVEVELAWAGNQPDKSVIDVQFARVQAAFARIATL